jgi:hypothetical protein
VLDDRFKALDEKRKAKAAAGDTSAVGLSHSVPLSPPPACTEHRDGTGLA